MRPPRKRWPRPRRSPAASATRAWCCSKTTAFCRWTGRLCSRPSACAASRRITAASVPRSSAPRRRTSSLRWKGSPFPLTTSTSRWCGGRATRSRRAYRRRTPPSAATRRWMCSPTPAARSTNFPPPSTRARRRTAPAPWAWSFSAGRPAKTSTPGAALTTTAPRTCSPSPLRSGSCSALPRTTAKAWSW